MPVVRLKRAAESMAAGDLRTPVPQTTGELEGLADALGGAALIAAGTHRDADGQQTALDDVAQPAIAPHVTAEVRPGAQLDSREALGHYVRAATIPMFHPVGTAKMGASDDPEAVVGPDGVTCLESHLPAGRLVGLRHHAAGTW